MTKILLAAVVLAVAVFTGWADPARAGGRGCDKPVVTVTAEAAEKFAPDRVTVTVSVETTGRTAGVAVSENAARAERVIAEAKKALGPEDTVTTGSYNIYPVYDQDDRTSPSGFRARNTVVVNSGDIEGAGKIIDLVVGSGANRVDGISFSISETTAQCRDLLKEASRKARDDAAQMARNFGVSLGGVRSISQSCSSPTPPVFSAYTVAKAATPIEAGDVRVSATVTAVFALGE